MEISCSFTMAEYLKSQSELARITTGFSRWFLTISSYSELSKESTNFIHIKFSFKRFGIGSENQHFSILNFNSPIKFSNYPVVNPHLTNYLFYFFLNFKTKKKEHQIYVDLYYAVISRLKETNWAGHRSNSLLCQDQYDKWVKWAVVRLSILYIFLRVVSDILLERRHY